MTNKVLVILAHPDISGSKVNKALKEAIAGVENFTVRELYKEYPDGKMDVKKEQKLLLEADAIVFQFPFYWYSSPSLLKEWQDMVLEYGFAYGSNGTALKGKLFFVATSTGGPKEAYAENGYNRFGIDELLRPFEAMANLTGMVYKPPFVVNGARTISDAELKKKGEEYRNVLAAMGDRTKR